MSELQLLFIFAVMVGSGYPLAVAILRQRSVSEQLLLALPVGLAFTTLVLQIPGKLGVPLAPVSRMWAAAAISAGLITWKVRFSRGAVRLSRQDVLPLGAVVALVIALGAIPLLSRGGKFYGRAFGDQLNYSLMANYVLHGTPRPSDISRPDLRVVPPAKYLDDRPGDGVVLAFVTAVGFTDDISATYFYGGVVSVLGWFAGAYMLLRRWSHSEIVAMTIAVLVAIAPSVHVIYLESYMGQAMASCLLLTLICLTADLIEALRWPTLIALALCLGFVFATYFEFYAIAVLAVVACAAGRVVAIRRLEVTKMLAIVGAIGLSLVVNLPGACLASRIGQLSQSGGTFPTLAAAYPWAFQPEGLSRLILGDLAAPLPASANLFVAVLVAGLTVVGVIGLWRAYRDRATEAASILMLLLLPLAVLLLPGRRPYSFYKLIQSFWPLCFLGFGDLFDISRPRSLRVVSRWSAVALAGVLAVATSRMLWLERGFGPGSARSGMNSYLADNSFDSVRRLLASIPSKPIYVVYPTPVHFRDWLANGWFLLFAGTWTNDVTAEFSNLGDHAVSPEGTSSRPFDLMAPAFIPPARRLLDTSTDTYVVQLGTPFIEPSPRLFQLVAQQGRMRLYRRASPDWVLPYYVVHPADKNFLSLENGVTISTNDHLRIEFQSAVDRPNGLTLVVSTTDPGDIHLYTSFPYGIVVPIEARTGATEIPTGPFRKGTNQVMLRALAPGDDPAHATRSFSLHISHIEYRLRGQM